MTDEEPNMTGNNFHALRDPFDPNACIDLGLDCNGCGLSIGDEIGYHEPSPEAWDGYLYWCGPCAAEDGVEVHN